MTCLPRQVKRKDAAGQMILSSSWPPAAAGRPMAPVSGQMTPSPRMPAWFAR
jgi:hypothetical protein